MEWFTAFEISIYFAFSFNNRFLKTCILYVYKPVFIWHRNVKYTLLPPIQNSDLYDKLEFMIPLNQMKVA